MLRNTWMLKLSDKMSLARRNEAPFIFNILLGKWVDTVVAAKVGKALVVPLLFNLKEYTPQRSNVKCCS